ncbi:CRISPR-associated protein Cas2 [Pararhizobium sp. IMCC21322]|uniref:CRISPR-associated protein Cas2 n=1 Tax=Pararhizobium sp. IMCC21322 TaxID=3067903 RepID=UPI0027414524|nr:CRISPR-associated protein Cas2 [Pararhizobium sp. IMCC21322]
MTTYVFTYDLIKQKDYPKLWDELKRLEAHRALNSFWLIDVDSTAKELGEHLRGFVDDDDRTWVSELTNKRSYLAKNGTNDWLSSNPSDR